MGTENDLGLQDPIVYTQARCDEAGEEHRDGSNVGFLDFKGLSRAQIAPRLCQPHLIEAT